MVRCSAGKVSSQVIDSFPHLTVKITQGESLRITREDKEISFVVYAPAKMDGWVRRAKNLTIGKVYRVIRFGDTPPFGWVQVRNDADQFTLYSAKNFEKWEGEE